MRATVGFCAVACMRRPVCVRLRKSCSATTAAKRDCKNDQALQRDRRAEERELMVGGERRKRLRLGA